MSKRGVAYFLFIKEWANYVNQTIVSNENIPWNELPDYLRMIKIFLNEFKFRPVNEYPDSLKEASL